jgi:hypothetical protein
MYRTWTVSLFAHEQPSPRVWQRLVRLATKWNARQRIHFEPVMETMWHATFDAASKDELDALITLLREAEAEHGATHRLAWRDHLEARDYDEADFVGLLGVGAGTEAQPLVVNEAAAFVDAGPCSRCGHHDAFDVRIAVPPVVDEAVLEVEADGALPGAGGWDLLNLAHGGLLASIRLVAVLEAQHVSGFEVGEVHSARTGRPSERVCLLSASRAILAPCPVHTRVDGAPHCAACGTAHGMVDGLFRVGPEAVGDDGIVSRHPGRSGRLFVRRDVWGALDAAGLNGLGRFDVMAVCDHSAAD